MKKILTLLAAIIAIVSTGFTQTMMIEMDESLTGKKHVLRTISVKDGAMKSLDFENIGDAKIEMVKAIEEMNRVQLFVSEYTTTEFDIEDDVYIRYSFVLSLDMAAGPPMPGGMPGMDGMPGMEGMPEDMQGGGPGGMPPGAPQQAPK